MSSSIGERRAHLQESQAKLLALPTGLLLELPGRPNVCYQLRGYNGEDGARQARLDVPFLFKAFETGQIGPKRLSKLQGEDRPRVSTIHEYLDWTATGRKPLTDTELDFGGFKVLVLHLRDRPLWPPPNSFKAEEPAVVTHGPLVTRRRAWPPLTPKGKAVSAAALRCGPGYIEVPFVATHEAKRNRGYARCVLEAIENIARACRVDKILLCSTNDPRVRATWEHMGFRYAVEKHWKLWDVWSSDLLYMENTVQMYNRIGPQPMWKSVLIRHQNFVQRTYVSDRGSCQDNDTASPNKLDAIDLISQAAGAEDDSS